ncbi:hypothetical protein [Neobacillus cucumis]|uniref:hypothetical protein n=1 Tax=Neobacillus cucumis TaxID=1740721 RepID=UPI0019664475|nr:hypothetical protein [Neobacillus cucumis]MBM7653883.1 multisubunit Na+/H+ antiporter MnhB subunit [Neobacillus cucumis]MED4225013.1 hypothetical protein [Neobacillus cucumis]
MKWGPLLGCTALIILIILFQWPKLNQDQKKEKAALIILSALGWIMANLLLFFPDIPGPTELVDWIYRPLGKLIE